MAADDTHYGLSLILINCNMIVKYYTCASRCAVIVIKVEMRRILQCEKMEGACYQESLQYEEL